MQHAPKKTSTRHDNDANLRTKKARHTQFNMHNIYPKEVHSPDVGRGTDNPDNIRRQKQDYFDNWQPQNKS
jgi:hypothetical protein